MLDVAAPKASLSRMTIHLSQKTQITSLKQNEDLIKVLIKYSDFSDIFSKKKGLVLPEQTEFN